ncbi:MAG: NUDIX domain-containing protein [Nitrososphaerota archaeon]
MSGSPCAPRGGPDTAAVAAVIDPSRALLVVKRSEREGDPWSGHWALPGGRWREGDRDLGETIRREVLEETSIDLAAGEPIGWFGPFSPSNRPELRVSVLAVRFRTRPEVLLGDELVDHRWVSVRSMSLEIRRVMTSFGPRDVEAFVSGDVLIWGLTARIIRALIGAGVL